MKLPKEKVAAAGRVAKFVWENRKAELALAAAVLALAREIVQAATGH